MWLFLKQNIEFEDCCIDDDTNINIFLMGYCTAFALALNEILGYYIYKIKNGKHYFCYKVIDKNKIRFIDVRGVFDKEESF